MGAAQCGCEEADKQAEEKSTTFLPAVPEEDPLGTVGGRSAPSGSPDKVPVPSAAGLAEKATDKAAKPADEILQQEDENGMTPKEPERFFEVFIQKTGPDDKLGMDVKHIHGKLEVVQLFADGAIARSNRNAQAAGGDTLQIGDIIHRVNDVESSDHQMVAECRLHSKLNLYVSRGSDALLMN